MASSTGTEAGATMEISVSKQDLLRELTATQGVVERKTTIPILSNFLFEASGDKLSITATDLDLSLRTSCAAKVKKEGSCTIPARKLYDYVKLLGDGEISIKLLENHWVQIRSGRSNTKMVGMARANFPALPVFPAESAIQLPAQVLRNLIAKTIFSISNEESRYTLNGALMVLKPESLTMVATDGHRLAHVENTNAKISVSGELKVLVPKKAMAELSTLLNSSDAQVVEFARDESTLFFRIGGRLLTSRQLTGQFPNYEAVLPRDNNKALVVHCDELSSAIQRVAQFADERSNAIRMRVEKNELKISSSNTETGESEDSLETAYAGDAMVIGFNSQYLLEFLKVVNSGDVRLEFKDAQSAGQLRPDEPADSEYRYRYIVMPMRI
ncbi:MAG TPA: DNA polymerase III subunit beta [Candidatus Angelobacter sp.]|jgi:DNA polymerase-3 subunit beta|nr:DNA polymerase III subunit beta [Candidatus Angelobacter sp.]